MTPLIILIPFGFAFAMYKAGTWNPNPALFAAQKRERARADIFADVLSRHFDALDVEKQGVITRRCISQVDSLAICEADKHWLHAALSHIGAEPFVASNPWILGAMEERYTFTPIGHVTGKHKETRTAVTGNMYGCSAIPYDVWIDDYAISREDIASYVDRVNARQTLSAK